MGRRALLKNAAQEGKAKFGEHRRLEHARFPEPDRIRQGLVPADVESLLGNESLPLVTPDVDVVVLVRLDDAPGAPTVIFVLPEDAKFGDRVSRVRLARDTASR